ncbi:unnamed protein product [Clonostachys byssicola]|uniref:Uncharacterized protein n=1 Tax=Clonostachys byssicola TaxID=160290 RepID=A0A9N9XW48_9HYPO|nr:unnamed protein product [Clonostachys byssicola]
MATFSPASSVSNDSSFYTAVDSHYGSKSTTASSPVYENASPYDDARPLPSELRDHCHIFLDEKLYGSGVSLLSSILAAGKSRRSSALSKPISVPPASHIALLNTLILHPQYTTRATKEEHRDLPAQALNYLKSLLSTVGPLNADFKSATRFSQQSWSRRRQRHSTEDTDSDADIVADQLECNLANSGSLWSRAQDFWTVLGWAFNCSVLYPKRWRYWKPWLEFMLDLMEKDWEERERQDLECCDTNSGSDDVQTSLRQESIISTYMDQDGPGRKCILKAIFAHGDKISTSAFKEVFSDELKGPKRESKKRKHESLDLENGKFGDYFDDEDAISSGGSQPPTPQKPRQSRKAETLGVSQPGLVESIYLRLRVFKLLSLATHALGTAKELERLYDDTAKLLKVQPLPFFSLFVACRDSPLVLASEITLTKLLFLFLLPQSHKNPGKVDPEGELEGALTTIMLEKCFIIHPANNVSVEDNAKLSLVVEKALQLLWLADELAYSKTFATAVEAGVQARDSKVKNKRASKKVKLDADDLMAEKFLDNSAARIRLLVSAMTDESATTDED